MSLLTSYLFCSGYVPPEYVRKGIYSTKYDVYSFGVLLLQIISGKRTSCYYRPHENMNLLEYAYELWMEGRGVEFLDPSLDDTTSACKLMRCMQVALLCVQENSADRPSMLEVDSILKNETAAIGIPNMPGFSVKNHGDGEEERHIKYVSINDVIKGNGTLERATMNASEGEIFGADWESTVEG
ncbi:hypothetical protein PIB30_034560 [Stylosanthes scabra]|uniref:Protein kinase domain-containing protein n=1 Tax=Stylosanthes scabra TaxID=79078 RepID=A0ABU6TCK4_9FABA|nr:hypothetical protein [Stylosanthes scabra]